MSTPTIDVWGNRSSTCTQRILFTAAEANLPINFHKIDFAKGEHKDPAYIAKRQPFGKGKQQPYTSIHIYIHCIHTIAPYQVGY